MPADVDSGASITQLDPSKHKTRPLRVAEK